MNKGVISIGSLGLGAGLMYLFDPDRGRRRRSLLSDQITSVCRQSSDMLDKATRDMSNRSRGLMAGTRALLRNEEVTDEVVVARVRSKLGRYVSHPSAIGVTANQGHVTLSGPILAHEVDDLLACVSSVRGVTGVENRLEVHKEAGNISGLQGGTGRPGERSELMQANWSPATRLLMGAAGSWMTLYGANRRGVIGTATAAFGLGILARGITNIETERLLGMGDARHTIDLQKTIMIDAPVERVYEFFNNYENFPRFMANIREAHSLGDGRSHWVAVGPAGVPVEWDAVVTRAIYNEVLAWRSVPGSTVESTGTIQFQPSPDGGTRVHIRLFYNPPAGALGHAVATLFGANPKQEMDEDLVRLKSLLEEGRTSAHGKAVTREEIQPVRH